MTGRGLPSRRTAVTGLLLLGVGLLGAGRATWVTARTWTALAEVDVTVPGSDAAPVVSAAGLVVLATGLLLALARRVTSAVASVVAAAGGCLALTGALAVARAPDVVARDGALRSVGVGARTSDVGLTPFLWLVVVLAVATVLLGVLAAAGSRRWPVGHRHEAPSAVAASPADDWTALSRGEDPTAALDAPDDAPDLDGGVDHRSGPS